MKCNCKLHGFFPPKNLVYIWLGDRLHLKKQTFFPPKDFFLRCYISLSSRAQLFSRQKTCFFRCHIRLLSKGVYFPAKRLSFLMVYRAPFKSACYGFRFFSKHVSISRLRTVSQFYSVCLQFHSAPKVQVVKLLLWHFITDNKFSRIPSCKAKQNQH